MPPSRRRLLRLAAGVTAALAGCGGVGDPSADSRDHEPRREPVRPLAVVHVRGESSDPLFASPGGDPRGSTHLTDGERADELTFADGDAGRIETLVDDTDFERHSVYLHQQDVGECYRIHLTGVSRRDDSVHASFCRDLRSADAECSQDRRVRVGHAIRLPFAGDDFSGTGVGFSTHCGPNADDAVRTRTGGGG